MKQVCVPENPCTGDGDCTAPALPTARQGAGCACAASRTATAGTPAEIFCNEQFQCEAVGPRLHLGHRLPGGRPAEAELPSGRAQVLRLRGRRRLPGRPALHPGHQGVRECFQASHCTLAPYRLCLLPDQVCVECLDGEDCLANERLQPRQPQLPPIWCAPNDNDCAASPDGTHCLVATGDCVQCTDHAHCGATSGAGKNACDSGCESDEECQLKPGLGNR